MPHDSLQKAGLNVVPEIRVRLMNPGRNPERVDAAREILNLRYVATVSKDSDAQQIIPDRRRGTVVKRCLSHVQCALPRVDIEGIVVYAFRSLRRFNLP